MKHKQIAKIYPSSLNTFRVITIKTLDGVWHVAKCFFRTGSGGAVVDNISQGGILVGIDNNGYGFHAYDFSRNREITEHPDTAEPLVGIFFKKYKDIVDFALTLSMKFNFMGTIGWDIAWANDGLCVVEGNTHYSAKDFQHGKFGPIISEDQQFPDSQV